MIRFFVGFQNRFEDTNESESCTITKSSLMWQILAAEIVT